MYDVSSIACCTYHVLCVYRLFTSKIEKPRSQTLLLPVFDCLQYAQTKGEGLVHFITWMMLVSTQKEEESPISGQDTSITLSRTVTGSIQD